MNTLENTGRLTTLAFFISLLFACTHEPIDQKFILGTFEKTPSGVTVRPLEGEAKRIRLNVIKDNIIQVTASPTSKITEKNSLMVKNQHSPVPFTVEQKGNTVIVSSKTTKAEVSLLDGKINFFNAEGELVLASANSGRFSPSPHASDNKNPGITQSFIRTEGEAIYGLGQHQNGQVNLAKENVYLTTYNLIITIPYLISSNNYGILWDNNSDSRYGKPQAPQPLGENLTLYNADGLKGGLSVRYYDGKKLLAERLESDINYQFLSNNSVREFPMPDEVKDAKNLRVEMEGSFSSDRSGRHELLMYSSGYAKLSIDDELRLDRWRMNWNPWYHNLDVNLNAGVRHRIKIDWTPQGGYFRLLHHEPSAERAGELLSLSSETGNSIDYYFVAGDNADELISGYRQLTGKSVMLPRWAYGFWQSRERYKSENELLSALKEYRERKIPIDNIVLDWSYWPVDAWGSHDFDEKYFPDPKAMVDKVHDLNAQIMISVWPKFYPTTDNYKELNNKGFMLNGNIEDNNLDWIYPGYLNAFYDAFNPQAREMFWRQLDEKINVHGFDAWWLDAVEPDMHSNVSWEKRKDFMSPNHLGSGAEVFNAYALPHAESVYEGDRASAPDTRVFILTRSGFGGIQRTASAIWSGDTVSRWSNLKEQIAAGIGTAMAGVPNWTLDIGGFTPEDRYRRNGEKFVGNYADMKKSELAEWQELNVRWYQFGAFIPLYRSHGQNPYREIYNIAAENSEEYASMLWYTKLRYRLMPYIYSQAGDMYHKDSTLMRGLAMDFPSDRTAGNLNDQYMFGPAFLVNPVYKFGARSRDVYLPQGSDWYDFYTNKLYSGGQEINAQAPLQRMPLFVRAGSIIPSGPEIQYADQVMNADLTLNVYTGADGSFELYEDDGRSYNYEKGQWSRIPLRYDHKKDQLHIGQRQGSFPGMKEQRKFHIRWISENSAAAADFDNNISQTVNYTGAALVIAK